MDGQLRREQRAQRAAVGHPGGIQARGFFLSSLLPLRLGAGPTPPNPCPPHSGCPAWSPRRNSTGWGNFPGPGALHPSPRITQSPTVTEVLREALTCVGTQTEPTWTNRQDSLPNAAAKTEKMAEGRRGKRAFLCSFFLLVAHLLTSGGI